MKTEQTETHEYKANETAQLLELVNANIDKPELVRIYITRKYWKDGVFEVDIKTATEAKQ